MVLCFVKSNETHKWQKGPLEQQQLFIYSIATVNIVSMATNEILITHSFRVVQS